jgi:hypothetical protein
MINNNNNFSGITSILATTISATTFYGNGSNLTGISGGGGGAEITGGTYSSGTTIISNSTGGTINITGYPTKTSDLTNDGDNGVSHFISLEDLPSNIILYATTAVSDIGGYSKLVTSINDPSYNTGATDVSTGSITTTAQLISSLATSSNILVGNPGVFNITTIGNIRKTAGSGDATFYFEAYKRTSGGTETLVAISDNTLPVSNGTYAEFSASGLWNNGDFVTSDRIVLKFYANRIAGGSNPTYDFKFGGSTPIRITIPVPLNVIPASYTFTGGTVAGATNFTGGLTASTISATTYSNLPVEMQLAVTDESLSITSGNTKVTFRMPNAIKLTEVRASLTVAQVSGNTFTVDINENGASILSTKLTIDNTEKTSTTAAIPVVISNVNLADDAEITIDVDQVGNASIAKGLKILLKGFRL